MILLQMLNITLLMLSITGVSMSTTSELINYPHVFLSVCLTSPQKMIYSKEHSTHMEQKPCITDLRSAVYNGEEEVYDTNQLSGLTSAICEI